MRELVSYRLKTQKFRGYKALSIKIMLLDTVDKSKNATSAKSMAIDKKFNQKNIFEEIKR